MNGPACLVGSVEPSCARVKVMTHGASGRQDSLRQRFAEASSVISCAWFRARMRSCLTEASSIVTLRDKSEGF